MAKRAKYGMAKEDNYSWYAMLDQYVEYKKNNGGRNPRSSGGDAKEERLYYWMYNQTRLIKIGHMSKSHITALVNAGVDIPNKGNLNDTYTRKVRAFAKKRPEKGTSLYTWTMIEQKKYNLGTLRKEYLAIWEEHIEMIALERFGVANQKWIENYEKADNAWIIKQNSKYEEGKLYPWQIRLLREKDLITDDPAKEFAIPTHHSTAFLKNCEEYRKFLELHDRKPKQQYWEERSLYFWSRGEIKAMRKGSRSAEEIAILNGLGIHA
ncbi:MAG: hypothetical protein J6I68_00555 [Butyrivibrio sp.]|uniref:hypothetical protein n=1 Tax=Butyrivibrio sp. TaxID=28121 RepID=UPI001B481F1E|nr:hypothetical protein [Butyrivibrio sp.]MBP3781718.1 hypothetical protein [Butyrivibrio sp.]